MKQKLIFLTILIMLSNLFGKANNKPDFAYPQTVDKNAQADLKQAIKDNDAHAALNALIRSVVSQNLIDPASLPKSIKLVEETQEKFKDNALAGLYDLLLADMYRAEYTSKQYIYASRELPLEPLPDDITEWSGDQFTQKIKSLYDKACASGQQLSQLKITDYKDIIASDKLSDIYFPTVYDFVCVHVMDNGNYISETNASICEKALEYAPAESAPFIYWTYQMAQASDASAEELKQLYSKYADNEYASYILSEICYYNNYFDERSIDQNKWAVENIDQFLKKFPATPFADKLKNIRQQIVKGEVTVSVPTMCTPNIPFKVGINNLNANAVAIKVYKLPANLTERYSLQLKEITKFAPVLTINRKYDGIAPFCIKDSVEVTLKDNATYAIVPFIDGKTSEDYTYIGLTTCCQAYAFAGNNIAEPMLFATDSYTGQPLPNAQAVVFGKGNKQIATATTSADGIAVFKNFSTTNQRIEDVKVTKDGVTYSFPNLYISANKRNGEGTSKTAQIFTDRAIYHPGEKVQVLIVARQSITKADYTTESSLLESAQLIITLLDVNYETVETIEAATDQLGRATCEFQLPDDGRLTGKYEIRVIEKNGYSIGDGRIMVSDYRMPDFKVTVDNIDRDEPEQGAVTIKGKAVYYSGVPVQNAKIEAVLSLSFMWRWFGNDRTIESFETTTDDNGNFTIVMPKEILSRNDEPCSFFLTTINATSPSGTTASQTCVFTLGKKYAIRIKDGDQIVDGATPFKPIVEITTYDGEPAEFPLDWILKKGDEVICSGKIGESIDFSKIEPGDYQFVVAPEDETLADSQSCRLTIYNKDSKIIPGASPIFLPVSKYDFTPGEKLNICIGTQGEMTYVYTILSDFNRNRSTTLTNCKNGYHDIEVLIPEDFNGGIVTLLCVKDSRLYQKTINLSKKEKPSIRIVAESFRDKLMPGQDEEWKFVISGSDGNPVEAAFAIDMYNKALDALTPHAFSIGFPQDYARSYLSLNYNNATLRSNEFEEKIKDIRFSTLSAPEFNFYGYPIGNRWSRSCGGIRMMKSSAQSYSEDYEMEECAMADGVALAASPMMANATMIESLDLTPPMEEEPAQKTSTDEFRDAEVPLAIWAPMLMTNADGSLTYKFTVPNANATWAFNAIAWTKDLDFGNLMREMVASKPVMVAPNAPRFLRVGDKCEVSVSVINNTDSVAAITAVAEIFDPITKETIDSSTFQLEIKPNGNTPISVPVEAPATTAIGFRVKATNGDFSDGEQTIIAILPSMAQLIETNPFYLNPGETEYTTTLPSADDAKITLTYCENPIWSIVSALPGMRYYQGDFANFAAASIFSSATARGLVKDHPAVGDAIKAWVENPSDSMLVSMLEKNEELKIALLNATPWVQAAHSDTERMANLSMIFSEKEISKAISEAVDKLEKLQCSDGGWAWSTWSNESSLWITLEVLYRFAYLNKYGWMPNDKKLDKMIVKALKYVDDKFDKKATDIDYAIIRPQFKNVQISLNGQRVINNTIQEILKHNKTYINPATKANAAMALYYNGYKTKAGELMQSVKEFGVWSPSQGLVYPKSNGLLDYARILEAFALISPSSKEVDGLRQQLIINKQANDWGSLSATSRVVAAILSSGANWIPEGNGATVSVGDVTICSSAPIDKATGSIKSDISEFAGQQLTITTPALGPSYGAVFSQFSQVMDEVKAYSCDDLDIEKNIVKRDGAGWVAVGDTLKVGDRVKVTLTIHSKRMLQYVTIIDERPAAFEPVDQLPGYIYSEGVGFYRENRDSFTSLCVGYMPKGTYILTYEMHVGLGGTYSSGVATIQSQYAPEISAHSSGSRITVENEK